MKTIKPDRFYYVLFCGASEDVVCGAYGSKKEAQEVNKEIKGCPGKHTIKRCKIIVEV